MKTKIGNSLKRVGALLLALCLTGGLLGGLSITAQAVSGGGTIEYQGQTITLGESALYVDATLEESGEYSFKTLQEAVAAAKSGTKENPTVIYLAPDVYWTDDYTKEEIRQKDDLYGLVISQQYITLVGMTGNPDDVVIASDRGQNAGANGNFNTIGLAKGFHAKDITLANYCNVDLVYARDPSKSHAKRQAAITQAQVIAPAPGETDIDEWYFEHCNIVSRLNLTYWSALPKRSLYTDCHIECGDDSLAFGDISLFVNCDIELYSNTPCGSASFNMTAFLGCDFTTEFASDDKTVKLCKNTKPFAFIDCAFGGDMTAMEWQQGTFSNDLRQIVYNNTLNGEPLVVTPAHPEQSVTPDEEQLKAFKVGDTYNVYNLLNGAGHSEWDPLNQKDAMPTSVWNVQFDYEGITKNVVPELEGNLADSLEVTPLVLGGTDKSVVWSSEDDTLKLSPLSNGHVVVTAENNTAENKTACLIATASNGMKKVLHFNITPKIQDAPVLKDNTVTLTKPTDGKIQAVYELTDGSTVTENTLINWYRGSKEDGSDKVLVAQTTYVKDGAVPFDTYTLRLADVGCYIFCDVQPGRANTQLGSVIASKASAKITAADVAQAQKETYDVDLEHLAYIPATNDTAENNYEWTNELVSGYWYGGYYLPVEYRAGGVWNDKIFQPKEGEIPYTFAAGSGGAEGTVGLQTTTQGARLVYVDDVARSDMSMTLTLSPHKTAAQGFGSAKQYMDIFFKYDAKTMTGYGLRIERVASIDDPALKDYAAKSCTFTLMEYKGGVATPLEDPVVSTAFLPGCTISLDMTGNVLKADVTTTTPQDSTYPSEMPHEVHITHTFTSEVNTYSGFGIQHTGTAGEGKSGNRTTIHSLSVDYKGVTGEITVDPTNPATGDASSMLLPLALLLTTAAALCALGIKKREMR